jgi:phage FluMu gp28-like protein
LKRELERARAELETLDVWKLPQDPVEFCRNWLYYEPYRYMWPFLRDESHFIANLQARQTGKTFNGMAKILYYAFKYPESVILVTAPKYDQVKNIAFKALDQHLRRMKTNNAELFRKSVGNKNLLRTVIRLQNGSQIRAESPIPETIRGHTAKVVYLMEMNFIRDDMDLYTAVLFTLNTTNGYLIAESTPWNRDSVFYKIYHDPDYNAFSKYKITYTEALPPKGPLSPEIVEFIKNQLSSDPYRWKREMLCEWTEDADTWLPTSLIALAQDSNLDYYDLDDTPRGNFYIGVDFGKKVDNSFVAVIEALKEHKYLRHYHKFPLETSYGAVIGYIRKLTDNWRRVHAIYCDKTGVGDYIVEDMARSGLINVTGINFTDQSKEAMATCLKENMRTADCNKCGWRGFIENLEDQRRTICPYKCLNEENANVILRPIFHIPYDPALFAQLNIERYELGKTGKLLFNHPEGTHDDGFWATALAVYAAEKEPVKSQPLAKTI